MRFHLLDDGLRSHYGHHDHIDRGLRQAALARGIEVEVYGEAGLDDELKAEFSAHPTFSRSMYQPAGDPFDGRLTDFLGRRNRLLKELSVLDGQVRGGDILVLPTATPALISAVGRWRASRGSKARVAALVHFSPEPWGAGSVSAALFAKAALDLGETDPRRLWLGATNPALARRVAEAFGRPVKATAALFSYVRPPAAGPPPPRTDGRLHFGFIGGPRLEKGTLALPNLISRLLASDDRLSFVVQVYGGRTAELFEPFQSDPRVRFIDHWLDENAFAGLIMSVDGLVLPYFPSAYTHMISGMFCIAAGYGRPFVVPARTWLSAEMRTGRAAGVAFAEPSVRGIGRALKRLADDIGQHQTEAISAAARARKAYGVEGLCDELIVWAGGKPSGTAVGQSPRGSAAS